MQKVLFIAMLFFLNTMCFGQTIATEKSTVKFKVSNMAVNTVDGSFKGMKGEVDILENDLEASGIDVCISAATVNTDNEKRDEHLKNKDFFEVDTYPTICLQSLEIKQTNKGYQATGNLTMHGITKKIELPFTYTGNVLQSNFSINRMDYEIGKDTSGFMVGKEIDIYIDCFIN